MDPPVLWLTLWAVAPAVHRQRPESITSPLSHLSVVHMAIYPGKPLLALLSEPLSSSIQTSQCHPLNAVNQDHQNNSFLKCPVLHEAPTKCNCIPSLQ